MSDEQFEQYNSWTKDHVYEAYIIEYEARKKLEVEVNKLRTTIAAIRYAAR